jgi:dihydrodipicolinate synthase/N-acetylneuraminate lyase
VKRYPACILATCCVPWDDRGRFAEATFRRGVRAMLAGTRHLYVFGTAGEGYAVTDQQFDQVVAAFTDEMRQAGAEPMVGVISLSLGTILDRIDRCRDRGLRQFQISLPCWGALRDAELFEFFRQVCGRFPDCRFLHYNLPRTKRLVTGQEYGRLAQEHLNLVATKNCGDSLTHIQSLLEDAPQLQHFLSEAGYAYAALFAECGLLASLVTSWPKMQALLDAGQRRDAAALAALQKECHAVMQTLVETLPGDRIDGAYDKLFAKVHDPEFPLRLLPPYQGMSEEQFQAFVGRLRQRLPQWLPASG